MVREPIPTSVAISDLRPTQITVGMHEVAAKRKRWREIAGKDTGKFLGKHMIPVVLGPKSRHYVVDHHHLARALHEEGVTDLVDDPFSSLAGELRRAGGFAKDTTPFSEFLWADFLRRRVKRKTVERDFVGAIEKALKLAKSEDAAYLPGWCGPLAEE